MKVKIIGNYMALSIISTQMQIPFDILIDHEEELEKQLKGSIITYEDGILDTEVTSKVLKIMESE
jgi:hypothetical protein